MKKMQEPLVQRFYCSAKESERRRQLAPRHGMAIDTRLFSVVEAVAGMSEPDHRKRGHTKTTRHARCTKRLRCANTPRSHRAGGSSRKVSLSCVCDRARNVCINTIDRASRLPGKRRQFQCGQNTLLKPMPGRVCLVAFIAWPVTATPPAARPSTSQSRPCSPCRR